MCRSTRIGTRIGIDEDRDDDQDEGGGGPEVGLALGHEKLRVYQRGLDYACWTHSALTAIEQSAALLDHWDRAAESIVKVHQIEDGKQILARIVPLLLGLRGYLDEQTGQG